MKRIPTIAIIASSALCGSLCAGMRWDVTNSYHTEKVDFERIQQIHVDEYDNGSGRLFYHEYFYVYGINQAEFTFLPIRYHASLTPEALKKVLAAIGKLDPAHLEAKTEDGLWVYGTVNVGGKEYKVSASPDSNFRGITISTIAGCASTTTDTDEGAKTGRSLRDAEVHEHPWPVSLAQVELRFGPA